MYPVSTVTYEERVALMRRLQQVVAGILHERTGGRTGGKCAEVEELAAECGTHAKTIYRYLGNTGPFSRNRGGRGRMSLVLYLPRLDVLMRLAVAARASLDWIVLGKGTAPACVRALPSRAGADDQAPGQAA